MTLSLHFISTSLVSFWQDIVDPWAELDFGTTRDLPSPRFVILQRDGSVSRRERRASRANGQSRSPTLASRSPQVSVRMGNMNHASSSSMLHSSAHSRSQSDSPASFARPSSTSDIWGLASDIQDQDHAGGSGSSSAAISRNGSISRSLRRRGGPAHPLASHPDGASPPEDLGSDTRPTLKRLTSETEKRLEDAGYSFGSDTWRQRGSFEIRRGDKGKGKEREGEKEGAEVEVLIHQVKSNETIVGIALHYGIDLATLRKANKLWPTDPVHLRTHLYIPLDACHWNKASETFVRGPGEGQVTLTLKHPKPPPPSDKDAPPRNPREAFQRKRSKTASEMEVRSWSSPVSPPQWDFQDPMESVLDPWQTNYAAPRSPESSHSLLDIGDDLSPNELAEEPPDPNVRILDIVRVPASQLRFFPRATPSEPASSRNSFESDLRRTSLTMSRAASLHRPSPRMDGPGITTLPPPLPASIGAKKKNTVRIRPPVAVPPPTGPPTLANRLSSLFIVPPPPLPGQSTTKKAPARPRESIDSARSGRSGLSALSSPRLSRRSSMSSQPQGRVEVLDELEMQVQYSATSPAEDLWDVGRGAGAETHRRMSSETLKPNGAVGGSRKQEEYQSVPF